MQDLEWKINKWCSHKIYHIEYLWLFSKAMIYLLEIFIWRNKLCTFVLLFMFCRFFMISSKYVDCNLFKSFMSFMFDDLHVINLTPRHICLHWIMLNTKNGNRWCFENFYCVSSKFMRCFVCHCNDALIGLFTISRTPIPKGNKLGYMHYIKNGLLYSLIILNLWL